MYLSQLLANCFNDKERGEMVGMIKNRSMITWGHINLHGEFDFRRHVANDKSFDIRRSKTGLKMSEGNFPAVISDDPHCFRLVQAHQMMTNQGRLKFGAAVILG